MEACDGLTQNESEWLCPSVFKMHLYFTSYWECVHYTQMLSQGDLSVLVNLPIPLLLEDPLPDL